MLNPIRRTRAIRGASRGQTMVEYALLLAAIAVVVFGAMRTTGQNVSSAIRISSGSLSPGSSASGGGGVTVTLPDAS
ncbi:MAG: Flp family type IVb pilin [Candidatus Binataceae bacterium]